MASPLALRTLTCLTCLRRLIQPPRPAVVTQLRGKKTKARLIVQLTEDIPGWGPKGNLIRISRELMRTTWYPSGRMRYVNSSEWKTKGYVEEDISIRQRDFTVEVPEEVVEEEDFYDPIAEDMARLEALQRSEARHQIEVEQLEPKRALELLDQFIPATLTFERRLVHTEGPVEKSLPEPSLGEETPSAATSDPSSAPAEEPLAAETTEPSASSSTPTPIPSPTPAPAPAAAPSGFAARAAQQAAAEEAEAAQAAQTVAEQQQRAEQQHVDDRRKIHGSVSAAHIAQQLRARLLPDPEAARIQIGPEDVVFVEHTGADGYRGTDEPVAKVERIGVYEVKITPRVGRTKLDPVWRTIEVMPIRGAGGDATTTATAAETGKEMGKETGKETATEA